MPNKENDISSKELNTARFWVKQELERNLLPILPEHVEDRLFFEGRTAWNYKYSGLNIEKTKTSKKIAFNIEAILKKEFHGFSKQHHYKFSVICIYYIDTRKLKVVEIARIKQ